MIDSIQLYYCFTLIIIITMMIIIVIINYYNVKVVMDKYMRAS